MSKVRADINADRIVVDYRHFGPIREPLGEIPGETTIKLDQDDLRHPPDQMLRQSPRSRTHLHHGIVRLRIQLIHNPLSGILIGKEILPQLFGWDHTRFRQDCFEFGCRHSCSFNCRRRDCPLKTGVTVTLPNLITLLRLLLIPAFAWMALRYGQSVDAGLPEESLRWAAVATYTTASLLDGLDGWIARRFNQKSLMGSIMDPLVDKALLMTGLVMATFVNWGVDWHLPLWFIVLVIARDLQIIVGIWILYFINRRVPIEPLRVGKICTVTQMIAMGWIMLKITSINPIYPTLLAAVFTLWSACEYYLMGYRQLPKNQPKA